MPAALIASPVIGPVRNCATSSFGIEGRPATTRSSFLVRLGIRRLLGVGYASHTELRTGSSVTVRRRRPEPLSPTFGFGAIGNEVDQFDAAPGNPTDGYKEDRRDHPVAFAA